MMIWSANICMRHLKISQKIIFVFTSKFMVQRCVICNFAKQIKNIFGFWSNSVPKLSGCVHSCSNMKNFKTSINLDYFFLWKLLLYTAWGFYHVVALNTFISFCLVLLVAKKWKIQRQGNNSAWHCPYHLRYHRVFLCSSSSQVSSGLPSFSNITREFLYQAAKV